MQSLALDVNVVSEEGQRTEMRDEDDDLLRAAEELGIDLSGVRALAGESSDEELEGEDKTDAAATPEDAAEDGDAEDDAVPVAELVEVDGAEDVELESLVTDESAE
jgi:DNA-directed RNA polymerase subunit beta